MNCVSIHFLVKSMRESLPPIRCVSNKKLAFKDIVWTDNTGQIKLKNGYTVVVRKGKGTATTVGSPYEFELVPVNSIISDDRIGYCTEEDIIQLRYESQALSKLK